MPIPAGKEFRCEMLSWGSVIRDSQKLSWMIRDSGYSPDIIIAIGRGGYVPARIFCDYLLIHDLASIKVEHWGTGVAQEKATIKFPLSAGIRDKRVLLVDDITDTGDTLKVSLQYLRRFKPREIRTAVLVHKTRSIIIPDYFFRKVTKWRWIIFPWHIMEDLTEFIIKLKARGVNNVDDLKRNLKEIYYLDVSTNKIQEVLSIIG